MRSKAVDEMLSIDSIEIYVKRKAIKHVYLRVKPPNGAVEMSVPMRTDVAFIRTFLRDRVDWLHKMQQRVAQLEPSPQLQFVDGELHRYEGQDLPLRIETGTQREQLVLRDNQLVMLLKGERSSAHKEALLNGWYRQQLQWKIPELIAQYAPRMQVKVAEFRIKRMRTKWGTCNYRAGRIWLNLALAQYPPVCLEYVTVHEMVHLLEPSHNKRFWSLVETFMPNWKQASDILKRHSL